jgi:hypothetical protein
MLYRESFKQDLIKNAVRINVIRTNVITIIFVRNNVTRTCVIWSAVVAQLVEHSTTYLKVKGLNLAASMNQGSIS